ncbi:hypothetical protein [Treponema sp. R80B11-R83G3]
MRETSETTLEKGSIIMESGKVFQPHYKELLDTMPQDIVKELAKRKLEELEQHKAAKK